MENISNTERCTKDEIIKNNTAEIFANQNLNSITKVYLISRELRKLDMVYPQLFYAILKMKEEHLKEIMDDIAKNGIDLD